FIQYHSSLFFLFLFFFFLAPPTTAIYTLSLHDALPISAVLRGHGAGAREVFRRRDGDGRRQHHPQEPDVAAAKSRRLGAQDRRRSEEHTSELQSPYDLVCRLLLEKKKQKKTKRTQTIHI